MALTVDEFSEVTIAAPDAVATESSARVAELVDLLDRVLQERAVARRLGESGIVVRVDVDSGAGAPETFTLLLDRVPAAVQVGPPRQRETVRLHMSDADLDVFTRPDASLPLKILSGEITFDGQVRRLLRVMPILRAALIRAGQAA
jgi:hypothetical protein